jgi:peptidoglycan/xylan/chitin deacetylase (PgdA/CDA1 family)
MNASLLFFWRKWSMRTRVLLLSSLAMHALGIGLIIDGHIAFGIGTIVLDHAKYFWGSLWPHSRLLGPVLRRLRTTANEVWLTIDDGPSADMPALLDLLDAHAARATFFLVGERAEAMPQQVREIVVRGHAIGNHTQHHLSAWFWAIGPRRMREEISRAQETLTQLAGTPPRWFRAVAGMANPFVAPVLKTYDLQRVSWSARGFDAVDKDTDRVFARLARGITPGAILLLHEGGPDSVALMSRLLAELDARGYRTVLPGTVGAARVPADARSIAASDQQPVVERRATP